MSRASSWIVNLLLGAAVVISAAIIVPVVLGYQRYVIDGHSMEPTLPYGSISYEKKVPVVDLELEDIITFKPPPEYSVDQPVTHRIVEITKLDTGQRAFQTKGDNNDSRDPWTIILDQSVQPRMTFHVPYVGYAYIALSYWWVRFVLIVAPLLILAGWIAVSLWREAGREAEEARHATAVAGRGSA